MQSLLGVILAIDDIHLFCSPLGEWLKHVLLKISILFKGMKMLFVQLFKRILIMDIICVTICV